MDSEQQRNMEFMLVVYEVQKIRKDLPRCGYRKLFHLIQPFLKQHKIKLGRDRFRVLLGDYNLLIKRRKSRKTTNSFHHFKKYKNQAKDVTVTRPNQLWVSDITYIIIGKDTCYLSLITDAFSRKIVGWSLRNDLTKKGPIEALNMALQEHTGELPLMHHSDRGVQYCCYDYIDLLNEYNITISMTQNGDPYENALAERMNRTIKEEFLQYYFFATYQETRLAVAKAVKLYNYRRPHLSLNYATPAVIHQGQPTASSSFANPTNCL